jgi:glycosyltransferase involved in cell wall biosynthesis
VRTSVIIPTLNEEKLLEGMLLQFSPDVIKRHDVEVIVSDGGSTDRTLEIAYRLAHKVVENQDHVRQTISIGRNIGAAQAAGDVLVFLNADTLIKDVDRFFSTLKGELLAPQVAALTCSVEVFPHEERTIDVLFHGFYNWFFYMMNRVGMAMGRGECHIIRRPVFEQVKGYATGIAAGEDYDLFRRLEKVGKVKFLRDVVVYESPRRYRRFGYGYVTASWFLNFLSVFFLHRSISDQWKPVR